MSTQPTTELQGAGYTELSDGRVICGGCGKEMSRHLVEEDGGYWVFTCNTGRPCPNRGLEFVNP